MRTLATLGVAGLLALGGGLCFAGETEVLLEQRVSWQAKEAPLSGILQGIAQLYGINIVGAQGLDTKMTISLQNVALRTALDTLLADEGLGYEIRDDIVVILEAEPLTTRIHPISFSEPSETAEILRSLLSERGSLSVQARSNRVVVRDTRRKQDEIAVTLASLDRVPLQVQIEAMIISVNESNLKAIGVTYGSADDDVTTRGATDAVTRTNSDGGTETFGGTINIPAPPTDLSSISPTFNLAGIFRAAGRDYGLQAMVDALVQRGLAEVLSRPRITVLNRETARIIVGQEIPFNTRTTLTSGGNETSETEFKDVGIKLQVTPTISEQGLVVIDVQPEVSSVDRADLVSFEDPPITTTAADTTIVLADGETGLIGGLISSQQSRVKRSVPYLGDLPWIGFVFSSRSDTLTRSELLVILTPHIVRAGLSVKGVQPVPPQTTGELGKTYLEHGTIDVDVDPDVKPEVLERGSE